MHGCGLVPSIISLAGVGTWWGPTIHDPSPSVEHHAAQGLDRCCCPLSLGKHQFCAFETATKPVASCSMSAGLESEWRTDCATLCRWYM
jgi:hypothetical protein